MRWYMAKTMMRAPISITIPISMLYLTTYVFRSHSQHRSHLLLYSTLSTRHFSLPSQRRFFSNCDGTGKKDS